MTHSIAEHDNSDTSLAEQCAPFPVEERLTHFSNFITCATCLAHLTLLQQTTQIMMTERTDYERLHYDTFPTLLPVNSSLLGSTVLPSTVFSKVRCVFQPPFITPTKRTVLIS